jgi:hypothetical protein
MSSMRFVPAFDPFKYRHLRFRLALEIVLLAISNTPISNDEVPLKRVNSIIVLRSPIIPGSAIHSIRSPTPQEGDAFLSTASTDGLPGFTLALRHP